MSDNQRWIVIGTLTLLALILPLFYLHFGDAGLYEVDVLAFGDAGAEWGVFGIPLESATTALLAGVFAPILLLASAGYVYLGSRRKISN